MCDIAIKTLNLLPKCAMIITVIRMFNTVEIKKGLKNEFKIIQLSETESTNDALANLARCNEQSKTMLIASKQTKGKGRGEHSFYSPEGGLYMSLLYRKCDYKAIETVTALAACAVCRAIRKVTSKKARIKWINDVFVNTKKVCGILTRSEFSADDKDSQWVIVGIGINLTKPEQGFPEEIADIAGYLFDSTSCKAEELICEITDTLTDYLSGKKNDALEYYRKHSLTLSEKVVVKSQNGDYTAFAKSIEDDFSLRCIKEDGSEVVLHSGEVSVKIC